MTKIDTEITPVHQWTHKGDKVLLLKCVNLDLTSYNGFKWPESGEVTPKTWSPEPTCESGGLFGWPWGIGRGGKLPDYQGKWIVFEAAPEDVVAIHDKCKVPKANVLFCGDWWAAFAMVSDGARAWIEHASQGASRAEGYSSAASSNGDRSAASSNGYSSAASSNGDRSAASSNGDRSAASSNGYSSAASSNGYSSAASSNGYSSAASSNGDRSAAFAHGSDTSASCDGEHCLAVASRVRAGENGAVIAKEWDKKAERWRYVTGYVGEDGIKANTWYMAEGGKLKEETK